MPSEGGVGGQQGMKARRCECGSMEVAIAEACSTTYMASTTFSSWRVPGLRASSCTLSCPEWMCASSLCVLSIAPHASAPLLEREHTGVLGSGRGRAPHIHNATLCNAALATITVSLGLLPLTCKACTKLADVGCLCCSQVSDWAEIAKDPGGPFRDPCRQ